LSMNRRSLTPRATQTQPPLEMDTPAPRIAEIAGTIFAALVVLLLWVVTH
jgi:hypothetical protein